MFYMQKILLVCLLIVSNKVLTEECGNIELLGNKSPGSFILKNSCDSINLLSNDAELELVPDARVWLKTTDAGQSSRQFICQNNDTQPVIMTIVGNYEPWISFDASVQCTDWLNQSKSCTRFNSSVIQIQCVTSLVSNKKHSTTEMERGTSVKLKALNFDFIDSDLYFLNKDFFTNSFFKKNN